MQIWPERFVELGKGALVFSMKADEQLVYHGVQETSKILLLWLA